MEHSLPIIFGLIVGTISFLYFYLNGYLDLLFLLIKNYKLIHNKIKELNITPEQIKMFTSMLKNQFEFATDPDTVNTLQNALLNNASKSKKKNETYISKSKKCIHIYYDYLGKEYMLTVPYNGLSSVDMIQYQMDAIYENGETLTITQQPGIPYLITNDHLNCLKLKAINHETDVYHEYKNELPDYCREICDS